MKVIKQKWNKFRIWLIGKLLTDSEKYLLYFAVDNRIDRLEHRKVNEPFIDADDIESDINELWKFKRIFSTKDFK